MSEESNYLYKTFCSSCDSSDANAVYDDGHTYCFSCGHRGSIEDEEYRTHSKPSATSFTPLTGDFRPLSSRGINLATCEHYDYFWSEFAKEKGGELEPVQVANIRDEDGKLVGQKIRFKDKEFRTLGKPQKALFGMHKFRGGRRVVITEGELDTLSVSQIGGNKYPVVSVPTGAKGAMKVIASCLDWLNNFQEIVLLFDNDEEGKKATQQVASILPPNKVKIGKLPNGYKDANDGLMDGNPKAILDAIFNAEEYKPDGIVTIEDIMEDALTPPTMGLPWFLPTLTDKTYGRNYGTLHFIGAGTGIGKTDFLVQQIEYDIYELNIPVGVFLLEQGVAETAKRIAGKHKGKFYHVPSLEESYREELREEFKSPNFKNLYLYDSWGVNDWDSIKAKIIYLVAQGVRVFYIDHLTALATGSESKDEKKELERITADMASVCKKYNIYMLVVSHLATPEHGSHEEGARVKIRHFKGSRAIGFWAHFMFGIERNQQADDEDSSTAIFRVLKDRLTGQSTGFTLGIGYDPTTGRQFETDGTFDSVSEEDGMDKHWY